MSEPSHEDAAPRAGGRLALSLAITLLFTLVEALAGWLAGSLALLADAAHNFTDVLALALSWFAWRQTMRPADKRRTFGYHRAGILAALVNATGLAVLALGIFYEAFRRLQAPPAVKPVLLTAAGAAALLVNAGTAWLVHRGSQSDLNLRSAFLHLLGDVYSSAGAALAGVAIMAGAWSGLDPLVSLLIGLLILWNAWRVLRETLAILMESAPADIDMEQLVRDIAALPGVSGVHDLHVWSISRSLRALSAHIAVGDIAVRSGAELQKRINNLLRQKYHIGHSTLQLECPGCEPNGLFCALEQKPERGTKAD